MSQLIRRGDIFYADLGNTEGSRVGGIRPVVIIQNDVGNKYSPTVIVAVITSSLKKAKLPTHIEISSEEYNLKKDAVILLEYIMTVDKIKLKEKISSLHGNVLERIEKALDISFEIHKGGDSAKLQEYKEYMKQMSKPLIITEGKTDVQLIETAWKKLYPNKQMFFECTPSGIEYDKEEREGNADSVRRKIEYLSNTLERPIIGLFDNDREGNEKFKGLSGKIFEKYDIKKEFRKHNNKDVWGMLLPVPNERTIFVTDDDATQRYFVIEHYFSDDILKKHHMYGSNILGTCVFKINNRKDKFSKEVSDLDYREFKNFEVLFDKIKLLLNVK